MKSRRFRMLSFVFVTLPVVCRAGLMGNFPSPPAIIEQPVPCTVYEGDQVQFFVRAVAFPLPMTFQWRRNGVNVPSSNTFSTSSIEMSSFLIWSPARSTDAGNYDVVVTNSQGHVMSQPVTLTVLPPNATITTQPGGGPVTAGDRVTLRVGVTGPRSTTFQWKKDGLAIPGATLSSFTLNSASVADSALYTVLVTAPGNAVESEPAVVTVMPRLGISQQPVSQTVPPGATATFRVEAVGTALRYQWLKNTTPIVGATNATLVLPAVSAADMGFYTVVLSVEGRTTESTAAVLTVVAAATSRLANISSRGWVRAGAALTPGFVLRGAGVKQLVIRAVGPGLAGFGIDGALANPNLELLARGARVLANDDWSANANVDALTRSSAAIGAFPLVAGSQDAALFATIDTNGMGTNYSARVTSANPNEGGLVLAEIYDSNPAASAVQIVNISTLAEAGLGANALVAGFVVAGSAPKRLLLRAVGPGLSAFGVGGALANPVLRLFSGNQSVAQNDDWDTNADTLAAFATAGAFALPQDSKDSALVINLPPGSYSAEVTPASGGIGVVLLEIYDLDR